MATSARDAHADAIAPGSLPPFSAFAPASPAGATVPWSVRLRRLRRTRPSAVVGFAALGLVLALAVVGPWLVPHDPLKPDPSLVTAPPSGRHWFGTDQYGR